jgi:hypothetical protein
MNIKIHFSIIVTVLFLPQINTGQTRYYTVSQMKDTLMKYENPYIAFTKLYMDSIPIVAFRKDSVLLQKANGLFNLNYIKDLCFQRRRHTTLNWYDEYNKKGFIAKYISTSQKLSWDKSLQLYDSLEKNNNALLEKYFNSALKNKIKIDSINCYSEEEKMTFPGYIRFHAQLMTQTGYDTIRAYYDRYYQNFDEDEYFIEKKDAVIIGLLNMGDPELRAKYDTWFDKKLLNRDIKEK